MICERPRGLGEIGARLGFRGHLKMVSEEIQGIGLEGSHERIAISLEQ